MGVQISALEPLHQGLGEASAQAIVSPEQHEK